MKNTPHHHAINNHPCYLIDEAAARFLAGNIIPAPDLALLLGVSLSHLGKLAARGTLFRKSHGQYHLAESVANYVAHKAAALYATHDECLDQAEAEGISDPAAAAREWTAWHAAPAADIETARRRHQPFDTPAMVFEFQTTLREIRLGRKAGGMKPEHFDAAAEEVFQIMRRVGMNNSAHETFAAHSEAFAEIWPMPGLPKNKAEASARQNRARLARAAARAVADEEEQPDKRFR